MCGGFLRSGFKCDLVAIVIITIINCCGGRSVFSAVSYNALKFTMFLIVRWVFAYLSGKILVHRSR